jgi:hypothetical protein
MGSKERTAKSEGVKSICITELEREMEEEREMRGKTKESQGKIVNTPIRRAQNRLVHERSTSVVAVAVGEKKKRVSERKGRKR